MTKQTEFYTQLKQETETKTQIYKDFAGQIIQIQVSAKEKVKKLNDDMKALAKQIKDNNKLLQERGQEIVPFEIPKKTKGVEQD